MPEHDQTKDQLIKDLQQARQEIEALKAAASSPPPRAVSPTQDQRVQAIYRFINDAVFVSPLIAQSFAPFIDVNDSACLRYGYTRQEFLNLTIPDIDTQSSQDHYKLLAEKGRLIFESTHIKKSGETFPVEINANIIDHGGQKLILAAARDISDRKQAEMVLRESEEKHRTLYETMLLGVVYQNAQGEILSANPSAQSILGLTLDQMQGRTSTDPRWRAIHPDGSEFPGESHPAMAALKTGKKVENVVMGVFHPHKNSYIWININATPIFRPGNDRPYKVYTTFGEITERVLAQKALEESEEKFRNIVEASPMGMHLYQLYPDGRLIFTGSNPAADRILGVDNAQFIGKDIEQAFPPLALTEIPDRFRQAAEHGTPWKTEQLDYEDDKINGLFEIYAFQTSPGKMASVFLDITERKNTEKRLKHIATHDLLTNLPNRSMFRDRLIHAVKLAKRHKMQLAVLHIDLDNFKSINDAFGHVQGNYLIQFVSQRLVSTIRESDTIARLGGDEFAILLENVERIDDVFTVINKISDAITTPVEMQGSEVFITSSIGISIYPTDGEDADTLIENADRATSHAKRIGHNNFHFYSKEMKTQVLQNMALSNQLRQALTKDQLEVYYQPLINSQTEQVFGVEALLRWKHPTQGLISPDKFIPLAEDTGLIVPIGEWVLKSACEQFKAWQKAGLPIERLSINLSGRELLKENLLEALEEIFEETRLSPGQLELELTENIVFKNLEEGLVLLTEIKKLGVRLAVDDFGTGYSTLQHLAYFPFNTLKIAQQFASQVTSSPNEAAIVNGIVNIANNLKMDIIAEGIENEDQLSFYEKIGCHLIQGWIFSKALPAKDIPPLFAKSVIV